jgi:hypothetical protein
MRHLVIGIPARNEAATIVALAEAIEDGAGLLGEVATVELVLAYQDSDDDTLGRFLSRHSRIPQRVLRSPAGASGKGRNVKLLVEHAVARDADLLLVDGDMRDYAPVDVARFVAAGYDNRWDLVLPLWCRPWGHANVTNYLAVPLLYALFGARVRQPLAGQRLLTHHWLRRHAPTLLPDDYGVDVALTMAVLDSGGRVGQVVMPRVDHDDRQLNSRTIMVEVARTALQRVAAGPARDRSDLAVPGGYARQLTWPEEEDGEGEGVAMSAGSGGSSDARRAWLDALAAAVRQAAAGANPQALATALTERFFDHADRRRREPRPELAKAEAYVWDLGDQLAALLS